MISVSIVTYNNERVLEETLRSLFLHLPDSEEVEITIIDNVSKDGTCEIVRRYQKRHANLKLVRNTSNAGYGRGHNLAIRELKSRYHLILNPDIVFTSEVFSGLAKFLDNQPKVGMVVPKVVYPDQSLQPLNKRSPTVYDLFLRRFLPGRFRPWFKNRLAWYEMRDEGYDHIYDVPFIPGCFMFCRTDVLKAMNGFDERYFLYFEDADLAAEFRRAGYRTVFNPDFTVIHMWSRAYYQSAKMAFILARNGVRFFNKWGWKFY